MKYCLLWATCFIGLLQLSAVTCRSAHDKVIEKEAITLLSSDNEKYSTTVGPSVAYTGQEIERDENSTDKLALEPGQVLHGDGYYYYREEFNWGLFFLISFLVLVGLSLILGCILACCRRRRSRPGMILNRPIMGPSSVSQHPQPPFVNSQQQNYQQQNFQQQNHQQQYYQQQNYQQQNYQQQNYQQQNYQHHNFPPAEDLPPPYQSLQEYQHESQPSSQYQPTNQLPQLYQGNQNQNYLPGEQAQAPRDPSLVEFGNPVSSVDQPENAPLIRY